MKNILLGSVAGLAMVGTAAAADLPVKAKAAEYVKICSTYGAGFYYIPGTDTCLKVGGYVQADYYYQDYDYLNNADYQSSYFKTRGAIRLDARTQTEYGTLRSFIELRGNYGDSGNGFDDEGDSTSIDLNKAYIQFAGFTFGKVQSFFDYYADNNIWGIDSVEITSDSDVTAAAYTADFGGGFTATISIEDDSTRSSGNSFSSVVQPDIPALIGNINYESEWGGFQVSGAIRQLEDDYYEFFEPLGATTDDSIGWAVLGGVKFNLPTLGEGDTLYIEGTYSSGALGYTGINAGFGPGGFSTIGSQAAQDLYYDPVTNTLQAGDAWTIAAELTHYFTPQVYGVVFGNYGQLSVPDAAVQYGGFTDYNIWTLGGSLNWSPVKNLLFVAQYTYAQTDYDNPVINDYGSLIDSSDAQQVLLSVRRTF